MLIPIQFFDKQPEGEKMCRHFMQDSARAHTANSPC